MEMLRSFRGDKQEFCLAVIKVVVVVIIVVSHYR